MNHDSGSVFTRWLQSQQEPTHLSWADNPPSDLCQSFNTLRSLTLLNTLPSMISCETLGHLLSELFNISITLVDHRYMPLPIDESMDDMTLGRTARRPGYALEVNMQINLITQIEQWLSPPYTTCQAVNNLLRKAAPGPLIRVDYRWEIGGAVPPRRWGQSIRLGLNSCLGTIRPHVSIQRYRWTLT